jgi:hypothetical protein
LTLADSNFFFKRLSGYFEVYIFDKQQMFVRNLEGKTWVVNVAEDDTVADLEETISASHNLPMNSFFLVHQGRCLDPKQMLINYGIQHDSTVTMMVRPQHETSTQQFQKKNRQEAMRRLKQIAASGQNVVIDGIEVTPEEFLINQENVFELEKRRDNRLQTAGDADPAPMTSEVNEFMATLIQMRIDARERKHNKERQWQQRQQRERLWQQSLQRQQEQQQQENQQERRQQQQQQPQSSPIANQSTSSLIKSHRVYLKAPRSG